ncbi:FHA domain-containing protein [Anaerosporobacter sp.]
MSKKKKIIYVICILVCTLVPSIIAQVATADKIFYANSKNGYVYALSNAKELTSEQVKCQIDGTDCEIDKVESITNSDVKMRTVVLIDVSKSVTSSDRKKIKSILKGLITNLADNEQMEINSIGKNLNVVQSMTDDKFELYSAYEKVKYEKQATYITKILPDVIENIKQSMEADNCFYRVVIFSDDYEDENGSLSTVALLQNLQETAFPIYTIGCQHEDNAEKLKNFYDLSILTGGESFTIKKGIKTSDIVSGVNQFYSNSVIKVKVPKELRDGSNREVSFILQSESGVSKKISTNVLMDKVKLEQESVNVSDKTEQTAEEEKEPTWFEKYKPYVIGGSIVIVVLIGVGITILCMKHRKKNQGELKKQKGVRPEVTVQTGKDLLPNYETKVAMEFMDLEEDYNRTVAVKREDAFNILKEPEVAQKKEKAWHLKLKDVNNNRVFEKVVDGEIYIGRCQSKDGKKMIILDYDPSISKLHCRINVADGILYVEDLDSLNGTYLNGVAVDGEVPLTDQDVLDVGQVKLKVYCSL